ncbi:MAG: CopD family protein [Prochlorococcus sp.]
MAIINKLCLTNFSVNWLLTMLFKFMVLLHALAATVWTGGHLLLAFRVLPKALREQSLSQIRCFEEMFEPLGLPALGIQVLTGFGMTWFVLNGQLSLLSIEKPIAILLATKLLLLVITITLALHARLRLIPNINEADLPQLAWHIRGITAASIAFVVVGAGIRLGGF